MKTKYKCKKICALLVMLMVILSLTGCGKEDKKVQDNLDVVQSSGASDDKETETKDNSVKSDGYDKFSQLKIGMTEGEVNAILGEPIRVDKAYYYYNITVNGNDLELSVWIDMTTGEVSNIYGDFYSEEYREEFADSATDLSNAKALESGEIKTYDDCVNAFKTPGYLISIDDEDEKGYLWVNTKGGYLHVTVRADGTVKKYSGFC